MTRKEILENAGMAVNGDRQGQYGAPERSFARIKTAWEWWLNGAHPEMDASIKLNETDVPAMMALLKLARIQGNVEHIDSWVDLAGYAACGGELASESEERVL